MGHANTTPRRESAVGARVRTYYVLLTAVESPLGFTQSTLTPPHKHIAKTCKTAPALQQESPTPATGKRSCGDLIVRLLLVFCLAKSATGFATTPVCPVSCYKGFMDNGGCPFLVGSGGDTDSYGELPVGLLSTRNRKVCWSHPGMRNRQAQVHRGNSLQTELSEGAWCSE